MSAAITELYKKYRPQMLDQVAGNAGLKATLRAMVKEKRVPHFMLFTGPSGCGKTTIARILARGMRVHEHDYREMNCATDNGIDMVRTMRDRQGLSPVMGESRFIVVDEAHQLTKQAQEGLLKMLEDTPAHVYYVFCTTDTSKLLPTIKTRATVLTVEALKEGELIKLCTDVAQAEGFPVAEEVLEKIAELSMGSARKALVLLDQVRGVPPEAQAMALADPAVETVGFQLAQALQKGAKWPTIAGLLKTVSDEPEAVRRIVAGYFSTVALGCNDPDAKPVQLLRLFAAPTWYDTPKAQMVATFAKACNL
jgi:DNA polymerase III gamma/tau subunit